MNYIFDLCMHSLIWMADILGITYEEINVIIFCMIWPAFTIFLIYKAYFKNEK